MKTRAWAKLLLFVAMCVGGLSAAQAVVTPMTLPDGTIAWNDSATGSFSNVYSFALAAGSYAVTLRNPNPAVLFPADPLDLVLSMGGSQVGPVLHAGGPAGTVASFSLPFAAGSYDATVSGVPGGKMSSFGVTIAPIPEPEIWAMMAAGMGLVGFMARRRAGIARTA